MMDGDTRAAPAADRRRLRRPLFQKYFAALFFAVAVPLLVYGGSEAYFGYRTYRATLNQRLQIEARAAASRIADFLRGVNEQVVWAVQLPWTGDDEDRHRSDALRLLRQVPALAEIRLIDGDGLERVKVSRLERDVTGTTVDRSDDPAFQGARAAGLWYGPLTFRNDSEPFMEVAAAGNRRAVGVAVAAINLKSIWDVITAIRVGDGGAAFVADRNGRLVAHRDISLVLRGVDQETERWLKELHRVTEASDGAAVETVDPAQGAVLAAAAPIESVDWRVYAALPLAEALAPLRATLMRTGASLLVGALFAAALASWLARRMVIPISKVESGVGRIGDGDFAHRIHLSTGDEIERLAERINVMADDLATSQDRAERISRLKRFLSPQVAELIEGAGDDTALDPKRAKVVVIFCDLRGFTAFSAANDAQSTFRVLSQYYEALGAVVRRFDATLTHFSGDGVMVLLNAPMPCAEAPHLVAARFARAAQAAVQALTAAWRAEGFDLGFGVGFATGWATVGRIGYADRYDYTAIGSVANLASRLCDLAEDGQILVDGETAAALAPDVQATALGTQEMKGFGGGRSVYAVSLGSGDATT